MKNETRLRGHEMHGGCRLFALNKQEAVRCVQKADGIQQTWDGLADLCMRKCKSLEQLGDVDGSFRISPQENFFQYCEDRPIPWVGIAYAFSTLQTLVLHEMLLSQGLGRG